MEKREVVNLKIVENFMFFMWRRAIHRRSEWSIFHHLNAMFG